MEWMIKTQLGRRNLIPAQRLIVLDKFKEKVAAEAQQQKELSDKKFYGNRFTKVEWDPFGSHSTSKIKTTTELAKMAGVGTGTVARFNKVMKCFPPIVGERLFTFT